MSRGSREDRGRPSAFTAARIGLWFGTALGLAETAAHFVRAEALGGVSHVTPQIVWMAPLVYAVCFAILSPVLVLAIRRFVKHHTGSVLYGVLTFLSTVAILALPRVLHWTAILTLAAGLALRIATWTPRHGSAYHRIVSVSQAPLVVAVLVLAVAVNATGWWQERRAVAELPEADAGALNLIFIVWDTVRAASLGLYGFDVPTPNLDRLAARGVTFEAALATTSWTLPSHASMFTGHTPHHLSASWFDPLDHTKPTLAEVLAARGYRTGGFVSNLLYTTKEFGLGRGFAHYEDYRIAIGQAILSTALGRLAFDTPVATWRPGPAQLLIGRAFVPGRKTARHVNLDFLDWLDKDGERPFFAFLNYFDAHRPYDAPARVRTRFSPPSPAVPVARRLAHLIRPLPADSLPDREREEILASYHAAIAWLDEQLGALLDSLEQRGRLDETIIVLTSDHGEEFGEHGKLGHGTNLYAWQLQVPLVLVANGRAPPNVRVSEPVSLADLPATLAPWMIGSAAGFPGQSLEWTWLDTTATAGPAVLAELSPGRDRSRVMRAMAAESLFVIRNIDRSVELYDRVADPFQVRPLQDAETAQRLGRLLDERATSLEFRAPSRNPTSGR